MARRRPIGSGARDIRNFRRLVSGSEARGASITRQAKTKRLSAGPTIRDGNTRERFPRLDESFFISKIQNVNLACGYSGR